ncbi:N-acetylmuramoyl-L-alanine amidase [Halalkalibacterium halodurans]|uniref:N-acetylmuramoyl-L-alanine amidase n=1 Tax=Halalkalibacterium halodurans (strain ATCC BAA-125 / DSM 18197 / FERM 7344 / JCM 9153 / C-125) TaxID=272558 RepID=Q9KEP2_HALH5|nr:N-acetylmuramoyl-L-alanine amidase [Halalkalibacterium halodurans]MED4081418.1 N-acetylmuramoyl-L-alanine amidase [Halalkalibacterium halodurans]MED4083300.1 N-acetylmuramoyl-L-alanine amidase [Halalkalibacterium halodurans]MED4106509.1 N-acetylmuramoyl-L-alanine amidase [Halalkalibacterium halodurans]MED4108744.1 N-acetylmuramoyl-L-alanine amidase [Halalkalibacterium halodurans]MED4122695.1 N-acetylmuramoyl-L-alanine amidase [Halalkalibacterium halodurans]
MAKIFIDPGHGGSDPGAVANGLQEKNLTLAIARHIREILLNEYQNVEVRMSRDRDVSVSLNERANMANRWGADFFLSIHNNAGGGTGFESFIHSSRPMRTRQLQQTIHRAIVQQLNVRDRGQKSANFAVLRLSRMPALLTENLFVDNANDAALLRRASVLQLIARGHVNGLASAFNLRRNQVYPPPPSQNNGALFKVQSGAFANRSNALRLRDRLQNDGITPFVFQEGGLWKVQVGAFANRANAEAFARRLRNLGYDAAIIRG